MKRRGFTFIELMIVVATIAVLAAIVVPNFLAAQVRAKVARVHSDLATILLALEEYHLEHHAYPPNPPFARQVLAELRLGTQEPAVISEPQDPFSQGMYSGADAYGPYEPDPGVLWTGQVPPNLATQMSQYPLGYGGRGTWPVTAPLVVEDPLAPLTTPVPYLPPRLSDPFSLNREDPYLYVNWSDLPGGGLRLSPDSPRIPCLLISYGPDSQLETLYPTPQRAVPYDPTNGTTSLGDIFGYPR